MSDETVMSELVIDYKALIEECRDFAKWSDEQRYGQPSHSGMIAELADALEVMTGERDEALKALGASRAAFGDSEARRAELEAVIEKVRGLIRERTFAESLATDFEGNLWPQMVDMDDLRTILAASPSVVLEDRDREIAARAVESVADELGNQGPLAAALRERAAAIRKGDNA